VLTAHIASAGMPTRRAMAYLAANNLSVALLGGAPPTALTPQALVQLPGARQDRTEALLPASSRPAVKPSPRTMRGDGGPKCAAGGADVNASNLPVGLVAMAALCLGGCSGPQVRTLGTGSGALAFELRDTSMAQVEAEAARLCAKGYVVLRQAQNFSPTMPDPSPANQWLQEVGFWLAGLPSNQAQATVQCLG
jgi:hypothetical protein